MRTAIVILFAAAAARAAEKLSPFTQVRVEGEAALVEFEGGWYELLELEGLKTAEILDHCRRTYGDKWEKRFAEDLVRMWRASFERGVGVVDSHPLAEQRAYLESRVLPGTRVVLVVDGADGASSRVAAFVASDGSRIAQLYVRVDLQRRGIGAALLAWAKDASTGSLRLHTFERNSGARAFYERHGFRVIGRGFEPEWRLADLEYEWVREETARQS